MNPTKHRGRGLIIVLSIFSLALLVFAMCLGWNSVMLKLRVKFAGDQTQIFDKMRRRALSSDASGAVECLRVIINYYPSGSKQISGSELDSIVERERNHSMQDIIAFLRAKTGQNLGTNPGPWIEKVCLEI